MPVHLIIPFLPRIRFWPQRMRTNIMRAKDSLWRTTLRQSFSDLCLAQLRQLVLEQKLHACENGRSLQKVWMSPREAMHYSVKLSKACPWMPLVSIQGTASYFKPMVGVCFVCQKRFDQHLGLEMLTSNCGKDG